MTDSTGPSSQGRKLFGMNLDKMRAQARRLHTGGRCGARYLHKPDAEVEVCTLREGHSERHDWPSVAGLHATARALYGQQSALYLAHHDLARLLGRKGSSVQGQDGDPE